MAPLCKTLAIEIRTVSRPIALAQAVLTGDPVSNRLFRSAALARHVDALIGQGGVSHIVAFSGQMAQYLPARFDGPVLMDFVDVDSAKFKTYAEPDQIGRASGRERVGTYVRISVGAVSFQKQKDTRKASV